MNNPLTDQELMQLRRKGNVTDEQLKQLEPFFTLLKEKIHTKWEGMGLDDGQSAKLLKFQLHCVNELMRLMKITVTDGKNAAEKLKLKEKQNG